MKIKFREELACIYKQFIDSLAVYSKEMETMVQYVSLLDVIIAKAYIAKKYNYCCPKLVEREKSFFRAKDLRHSLIEHLQTNERYTPNDVSLGDKNDGILLYNWRSFSRIFCYNECIYMYWTFNWKISILFIYAY